MIIGIVGLPQSGKSTLFNALTKCSTETSVSAGGKVEARHAIVQVPDQRLDILHQLTGKEKKIYATIEYIDVAGLEKGSVQRKGFQEQFLASVRNVDALLCILRLFKDESVPHPESRIDPKHDFEILEEEFYLSDMTILEGRIQRLEAEIKKVKSDERLKELELLKKCYAALEEQTPLRELDFSPEEEKILRGFQFLTAKPLLIVLNIGEEHIGQEQELLQQYQEIVHGKKCELTCIAAKLEMEIAQLGEQDAELFRKELGLTHPALDEVIRKSYQLLGLISFFTVGQHEVRAWTIKKGTTAQTAAGTIHSDMERGFIRAEVVDFETLKKLGSLSACKHEGVLRLEGKQYEVQDGDVITFRFNV